MNEKINGRAAPSDDTRGLARRELRAVDAATRRALVKVTDSATRAHLEDVRDQVDKILDPKFQAAAPLGGAPGGPGPAAVEEARARQLLARLCDSDPPIVRIMLGAPIHLRRIGRAQTRCRLDQSTLIPTLLLELPTTTVRTSRPRSTTTSRRVTLGVPSL